jgi:hypothetical protein
MLRYALAVAAAMALISTAAFAEVGDMGTTKVITKSSPDGLAQKKVIIHRHDDGFGVSKKVVIKRHDTGYGAMVTKKKIIRGDNMYGSSMPGHVVVKQRTIY